MSYQPIKLPSLSTPNQPRLKIEKFLGVDTSSDKINIAPYRSEDMLNFEPVVKGRIGKRKGTQILNETLGGKVLMMEPYYVTNKNADQAVYYVCVAGNSVVILDSDFKEVIRFEGIVQGTNFKLFQQGEDAFLVGGGIYQKLSYKFENGKLQFSICAIADTFEDVEFEYIGKGGASEKRTVQSKFITNNGATIPLLYKIRQDKVEVKVSGEYHRYIDCTIAPTGQGFNMLGAWICASNENICYWPNNSTQGAYFITFPTYGESLSATIQAKDLLPYETACEYTQNDDGTYNITKTWIKVYGYNKEGEKVYLIRDPLNGVYGSSCGYQPSDGCDWYYTQDMDNYSYGFPDGYQDKKKTCDGLILNMDSIKEKLGWDDNAYTELFIEYVPAWWKIRADSFNKFQENIENINSCDVAIRYGVGNARDRLFLAGSKKLPDYEWYSELDDFAYFPDLNYVTNSFSGDGTGVMGYSLIGDKLATICKNSADGTNVFLRSGQMTDGKAVFLSQGSYQTVGACSKKCFAVASNEPLYLNYEGVYALTPSDVFGERLAQLRSYYANGQMLKHSQEEFENAVGFAYQNKLYLSFGQRVYVIDTTQASTTDGVPFTHRQFECFILQFPFEITCFMSVADVLYFGTADGQIFKYTDLAYLDCFKVVDGQITGGEPIECYWTSYVFTGSEFYNQKTIKKISFLIDSKATTGAELETSVDGLEFEKQINYADIDSDDIIGSYIKLYEKIKLKKIDTLQIRIRHNKPCYFSISAVNIDYVEVKK